MLASCKELLSTWVNQEAELRCRHLQEPNWYKQDHVNISFVLACCLWGVAVQKVLLACINYSSEGKERWGTHGFVIWKFKTALSLSTNHFLWLKKKGKKYSSRCSALAAAWAKNGLLMFWNKYILCSIVLPFPHRNSFSESMHRKALLMIYKKNQKRSHCSTLGHTIKASFLKDQRCPPGILVTLMPYF